MSGSLQAVKRYRVSLDRRRRAAVTARRATFTVALQRRARHVRVDALDASGRTLATAQRRVAQLRAGKRGVTRGRGIGT